ncbi:MULTISPECIES: cyclase family protein [Clostridium]|jgi:kynurenine formamidase|uniref:Cyclase family protein n=1 Tax=Clostridium lapidicellarium TaxID=3240931 RepID=A0ABV4DWK6_9CLOT|nr:cyclase family protein [uncultured Clostridium sp.]NLU06631.1 cyclase family protein [Clostridiales bacterium]
MNNSLWNTLNDLKKHKWVDLTHKFGPDTPRFASFDPAKFETLFTYKDGFFVKQYTFAGQYGTHLDPPVHFAEGGRYLDELGLKELVLPLVNIDLSEKVNKNNDYVMTVDDILEWEKKYGKIPEGSFVAFRSDWSKRWPDQDKFLNLDKGGNEHYPGWSLEALKFLYETRKISANGHETFDTDAPIKQQKTGFQGEYYVLKEDHYQIEVMANLDKVPPTGSIIFSIVPKVEKAPGFPVRSFAIIP